MIKYKNFSLDNIFLLSGYSEENTPDGIIREYMDEAGLEQKVRELVATKKLAPGNGTLPDTAWRIGRT